MPIYKQDTKKKDGKAQYRVVVNYTDRAGAYRQKTKLVWGKEEAADQERLIAAQLRLSQPDSAMTVQTLFEEYLVSKKHDVRRSTWEKSSRILQGHVLPYVRDIRLKDLSVRQAQEWKNQIAALPLATTSKNNIFAEFRALLNYAAKMEYIPRNPLSVVGAFRDPVDFSKPQDTLHYYTADQFRAFQSCALSLCSSLNRYGLYVFFCIAFYTGMRKGEINALKWSDLEGSILHVRRSVAQKIKGEAIVETPPKNKSSYRDLQAPRQLLEILAAHRARQMQEKAFSDDWRICGGPACLSDTSIANFNTACADAAALPHIRVHDFRHTHATLLINEGINIQEIARRLGHSNVEITWKTYAHLYPREEERAIKVLESINL